MTRPSRILLLTILHYLLLRQVATVEIEHALMSRQQHLNGYIFEDKVLYDQPCLSAIHCAHACLTRPQCVMFTMTSLSGGQGKCRGHSAVMRKGNDASQHVLGSYVFVLKERAEALMWLNKPCGTDSTCPATRSQCFASRCLCVPGYYYSLSQDTCVGGCDKTHLQPDFLAYPGSVLQSLDSQETRQTPSLHSCLQLCRADRHCRSVDLQDQVICTTHYSTARDNPLDFQTALGPEAWHFQRMCA